MAEFSFKMAELVTIIAQFGPKNAELGSIMDKLDSKIAKIAKLQNCKVFHQDGPVVLQNYHVGLKNV